MTIGNKIKLDRLCWNIVIVQKSKKVDITLLPSESLPLEISTLPVCTKEFLHKNNESLPLETSTLPVCLKEFLYRNDENENTQSIMFANNVCRFNGIHSQEKYPIYDVWRNDLNYVNYAKKNIIKNNEKVVLHYVKLTNPLPFQTKFPNSGQTYRKYVVNPRPQTPQGQSAAKPETPL